MTAQQHNRYRTLQESLKGYEEKEIEGYRTRTRGLPKYEMHEPNIEFYAKLEKRRAKNTVIELQDIDGSIYSDRENLLRITAKFYTQLYTSSPINRQTQHTLLQNVDRQISAVQQRMLDAAITEKELQEVVSQRQDDKTPGIDGITAEFYKQFWYLIHTQYFEYITEVSGASLPVGKNTSITALMYKEKGDVKNYRPISLINVDVKILTKVLTNRLKEVLPSVIHHTQTAVDGRKIDHTIHMLHNLIQIANDQDLEAAFIFLDQEKAFDRVNHDFLFKTMKAFGIGDDFIHWVRLIYSNASTRLKINGFLTNNIPLTRGVRQGCPLSPLLYVLIIEILALQIRKNPDIVGFRVGSEKIVSAHYADDAVITIIQNRYFKVIKELTRYEEASGAKINYDKTKGLWIGKWKSRRDKPLNTVDER